MHDLQWNGFLGQTEGFDTITAFTLPDATILKNDLNGTNIHRLSY